jgi:type II secretory pathway pseudopilin PulG
MWFYHWQTLISGVLALAAAGWAGMRINQQIQQTATLANQELARKFLAARCLLSIHLAEVDDYCDRVKCALNTFTQSEPISLNNIQTLASDMRFPSDSILHMTKALEFSNSKQLLKIIAKIIGDLQVLNSRISSINVDDDRVLENFPSNIEQDIILAAVISTMVSKLYVYARQENDELPNSIAWEDVQHRLRGWDLVQKRQDRIILHLDLNQQDGPMFDCTK